MLGCTYVQHSGGRIPQRLGVGESRIMRLRTLIAHYITAHHCHCHRPSVETISRLSTATAVHVHKFKQHICSTLHRQCYTCVYVYRHRQSPGHVRHAALHAFAVLQQIIDPRTSCRCSSCRVKLDNADRKFGDRRRTKRRTAAWIPISRLVTTLCLPPLPSSPPSQDCPLRLVLAPSPFDSTR